MGEKLYTSGDVRRILKISMERYRDWESRGFIKPSIPSPGQGRKAFFTGEDVKKIILFKEFLDIGFRRKFASTLVEKENLDKLFQRLQTIKSEII
jgi:DNA-binding transcriptional MerR regulator